MEHLKIGIIGAGHIAEKMAYTLTCMDDAVPYAIASRSLEKAQAFAAKYQMTKAYGSYEELAADPFVDLIYIATPHSHHYMHALLALEYGKHVLCEKPFTAVAWQAEELVRIARAKHLFIGEALWTRYMPIYAKMQELLAAGVIGRPQILTANLNYPISNVERLFNPELAGGALLDVGVYPLHFAFAAFGSAVSDTVSSCVKLPSGVDGQDSITLIYEDGRLAVLHTGILSRSDRLGIISGADGHLIVRGCNCPTELTVYDADYQIKETYALPFAITGFEYQVRACKAAIESGQTESSCLPHAEILRTIHLLDDLRRQWGVRYPWDKD
ncbi:MAG: Gfo/Idh/MocA family oxidoreductase [Prevotellaceae bacterium]|jgi:predicted dehydrogenase|nr:Gfo/Idh/MocA family oxidoreductase [Prevotellaceae bacterium]